MAVFKVIEFNVPEPPRDKEEVQQWAQSLSSSLRLYLNDLKDSISELVDGNFEVVRFIPQSTEPTEVKDGYVTFADGTGWDPGSGAGLYERVGGAWSKL